MFTFENTAKIKGNQNFMIPEENHSLLKREQFAVSLRKKKTQEILNQKRRKIMDQIGISKENQNKENTQNRFQEITRKEMEKQFYMGYPEWRQDNYSYQQQIIKKYLTKEVLSATANERIQYILNEMRDNKSPQENLALLTQIRIEMDQVDLQTNTGSLLKETDLMESLNGIVSMPDNVNSHFTRYLKLEAVWILTNISFGENEICRILESNFEFVNYLNVVLRGADIQQIDQVIWLIANIASDGQELATQVLSKTYVLDTLVRMIGSPKPKKSMLGNMVWCASNLARMKSSLTNEEKSQLLYIFSACLELQVTQSTVVDAVWGLSNLAAEADDEFLMQICSTQNIVQTLVKYADSPDLRQPITHCIGSILASDDEHPATILIKFGILDTIDRLLDGDAHLQQVVWSLSNIAAGSQDQVYALVSHASLVQKVFNLLDNIDPRTQREATFVFCNIVSTCQNEEVLLSISSFSDFKLVKAFVKGLDEQSKCVQILEALDYLLKLEPMQGLDSISHQVQLADGLDVLDGLQKNPNEEVAKWLEKVSVHFLNENDIDYTY